MCARRLRLVDSEQTDEALEDELGIQLEEAMQECTRELGLIPKMLEWQPWDVPADYKVMLPAHARLPAQHVCTKLCLIWHSCTACSRHALLCVRVPCAAVTDCLSRAWAVCVRSDT